MFDLRGSDVENNACNTLGHADQIHLSHENNLSLDEKKRYN